MIGQLIAWPIALFFWMIAGACVLALHNRIHFYVEYCFHQKFEMLLGGILWPVVLIGNIIWALYKVTIKIPTAYQWLINHLERGLH